MDPLTILSAFIPAVSDGIRGLINKWTGGAGAQPANVEEAVKLIDADIRRLETLAKMDSVGNTSQWVNNFRALMRPSVGALIVVFWGSTLYIQMDGALVDIAANLASSVVFYLFGDRTYMHFKRKD